MTLSAVEKVAWLRLIRSENIGPRTFQMALERYQTASRALEILPELATKSGAKRKIKLASVDSVERELDAIDAAGGTLITLADDTYPPLLRHIPDAPPVLTVLGHTHLLQQPMIGMVGARNASTAALRYATRMAEALGRKDIVIASGLARGLDTAAHQGALETGTVAVVAGGVDVIYPPENEALQRAIGEQGAVVSEQPWGEIPTARHFPRRNRIISGVGYGVLVVEAALRSGSLITARLAGEQGRLVFAVPGSPMEPRARGTNALLRDGAILTETPDDILEHLAPAMAIPFSAPKTPGFADAPFSEPDDNALRAGRKRVIECLSVAPVEVDDLALQTGVPRPVLLTVLLELELSGKLARDAGDTVSLTDLDDLF
ncbi:MAG: DNA-processing protein DprA [Alphaproteobacteria bacterium]